MLPLGDSHVVGLFDYHHVGEQRRKDDEAGDARDHEATLKPIHGTTPKAKVDD